MPMRDYEELKNVKIHAEQERIMDIICDAWEECRASDCPCDDAHDLPSKHSICACTALKYAKKIHEAGYAPAKWIDVNDRLPEKLEPVNIVWKNTNPEPYYENIKNKPFVGTAYYYNGKWWWFSNVCEDYLCECGESDIDCMDDGIVVTHWMPIQAPPEVYK